MIPFNSSMRRAAFALAAALGVTAVPVAQAGTVSSDATGSQATLCSSFQGITMSPAGDLTINGCIAASSSGGPTATPTCTVTANPNPVTQGGTSTLSASCSQGPLSAFQWTLTGGGPTISGQSAILTFPNTGTFGYQVQATNSLGTGSLSGMTNVVVNAQSSSGGPPPGCAAYTQTQPMTEINGQMGPFFWTYNTTFAMQMPLQPTGANATATLSPIQATGGSLYPSKLTVQFSVSPCPGDFTNNPSVCRKWGSVYQGAMRLYAAYVPASTGSTTSCEIVEGTRYYLNMRFINYTLDGPSLGCPSGSCGIWVNNQMN